MMRGGFALVPSRAGHQIVLMKFPGAGLIALLVGVTTLRAADAPPPVLELGSAAPDFTLPGVDGRDWSLKDFSSARVLVVLFTCNHCPTAQYYEGRVKQLVSDYRDKGVALVAISPNDPKSVRLDELGYSDLGDSFEEMKIRARDAGFNFPYLYDGATEEVSRRYGPVATPHAFVFDAARKLRYVGAIDDSERIQHVKRHHVRDAIEALLAGRAPEVEKTKAIGCSVKWAGKQEQADRYLAKLAAEPVELESAGEEDLRALRNDGSGKFRLVNFWATWCAPCIAEFHEFVAMHHMYRGRDFELVMVSMNRPDERDRVLSLLKEKHASNRNLIFASDNRDPLINAFNPKWEGPVPYTVLIDPAGKIVFEQIDRIDPLELKREILKALNAHKPW